MVKKNSKKCVSGKEATGRRFAPLQLEIKYPDTAILLLQSPEKPILLAAAAALAKFAEDPSANRQALFDLQVVGNVLGLIEHEDIFTRRFALKLLALMTTVPNVQTHLLKTDVYITFFTDMIIKESDSFLQEFSSRIIAELTNDVTGVIMLTENYSDVNFLFEKLKSPDPDIKKNCIEIITHVIKDIKGYKIITNAKDFSFAAIYELFNLPYPIMQQLALEFIECLAMHNEDKVIQEKFRLSGGVQNLLDILDCDEWNDLHRKVLNVINLACDNKKTADLINSSDGTKRLFNYMEIIENESEKLQVLNILVRLAETMIGKKILHNLGFVETLSKYLEARALPETQALVCRGYAKMTRYCPASREIPRDNLTDFILNLLNNDKADWLQRQGAAFTLRELFITNINNCVIFLNNSGLAQLIQFLKNCIKDVPWETQVTVIQAITAIADYSSLVEELIDPDLFTSLYYGFEPHNLAPDELKITCCEAISKFPSLEAARVILARTNALPKLGNLLAETESVLVRDAAAKLLLQLCVDSTLAKLSVHEGHLALMLKTQSTSRFIPSWNACIESLFNADLSMKFAYTGHLSLRDVTGNGFYVLRHSACPFPILEELFRLKLCPLEPIYVANFGQTRQSVEDDYLADKQAAFETARSAMRRESLARGVRVSEATINAWLELKFGRLPDDPDLRGCLEMFKAELITEEGCDCDESICDEGMAQVSSIANRARLLAVFVARQLSGMGPSNGSFIDQQLQLHLHTLKMKLETSVISIGQLRVGSYLERAVLFKVLADQLALPVSLVRGKYGRSWNEICVPLLRSSTEGQISNPVKSSMKNGFCAKKSEALPTIYLRENFIVDLMDSPGELIPIDSSRANRYRNERVTCTFACCG